jgi:hypothetical protein
MTAPRNLRPLVLALIVGLSGAAACKKGSFELEKDTDDVPAAEIVDVWRVDSRPVEANGRDTVRFMVRLPGRAASRVVKLTSSAGRWVEAAGAEVSVRTAPDPDSSGRRLLGSALLLAPTSTESLLVVVRATVGDTFYDTVSVRFAPKKAQ